MVDSRRFHTGLFADPAAVRGRADYPRRQEGDDRGLGRCRGAGMDGTVTGALPHLRHAAEGEVSDAVTGDLAGARLGRM